MQVRPRPQIPSLQQLKELSSTFGPASLIYIFKSLCYMMLQVRCAADMQSNLYFVLLRWEQIVHALIQAAPAVLAPTQPSCKLWMSTTTLRLAEQKRRLWQACQQAHASPASRGLQEGQPCDTPFCLTDTCRHDRHVMQEVQSSLSQYLRQWRELRSKAECKLRSKHGKLLQTAEEHIHHWWEYCSELLRP